jgi:P-type Ca2+ transporter type 2C
MGLLLGLLMAAFYIIFRPFVGSVSWAAIIVLGAWPLHSRVQRLLPRWPALSASVSSFLIVLIVLGGLIPVLSGLGPELRAATQSITEYINKNQTDLVEKASGLPVVGETIARELSRLREATADLGPLIQEYSQTLIGTATLAAQGLAWLIFNAGFFCLAVFFLFYYGESLAGQLQKALLKVDDDVERLIELVEKTVTSVLYGIVFAAIAQGILAGLGFAMVGARAPILLGITTMFFAVIPFGPPLVYLPVAMAFVVNGSPVRGIILALWGVLFVSSADNILKPYFIARQAKLPLPLVLMGVTGGVLGFGVIGVFVGPVVVGLVRSLWLGWVHPEAVFSEPEETENAEPEAPPVVEADLSQNDDQGGEPPVVVEPPSP